MRPATGDHHLPLPVRGYLGILAPMRDLTAQLYETIDGLRSDLEAARAADRERQSELDRLSDLLARIHEWTLAHGKDLCPSGADTYGEGMRDAKTQVSRMIARAQKGIR